MKKVLFFLLVLLLCLSLLPAPAPAADGAEAASGPAIRIVNSGVRDGEAQSITGKAKLSRPNAKPLTGELRVSFFWPFYSDYRVIELTADYDVAVVTAGSRSYLWVLARKPVMDRDELDAIVARMKALGFDVEKLEYPAPAKPEGDAGP